MFDEITITLILFIYESVYAQQVNLQQLNLQQWKVNHTPKQIKLESVTLENNKIQ